MTGEICVECGGEAVGWVECPDCISIVCKNCLGIHFREVMPGDDPKIFVCIKDERF